LRYISYASGTSMLTQKLLTPAVSFFLNSENTPSFQSNPLWQYNGWTSTIFDQAYAGLVKSEVLISISISRVSLGLVTRLALPMLLLVILAGFNFWAVIDQRVNGTITLLLAISALYIVVFQNIPLLGYMTSFDKFSVAMFIILFLCSTMHQFVWSLAGKPRWPTRDLVVRLSELVGRVSVIPIIFIIFLFFFSEAFDPSAIALISTSIAVFMVFVMTREVSGVNKRLKQSMVEISSKVDDFQSSPLEIFLFNVYTYRLFSTSMAHHFRLQKKKAEELERERELELPGGVSVHSNDDGTIQVPSVRVWQARPSEMDNSQIYGTHSGNGIVEGTRNPISSHGSITVGSL
jgi:hypothetical protein